MSASSSKQIHTIYIFHNSDRKNPVKTTCRKKVTDSALLTTQCCLWVVSAPRAPPIHRPTLDQVPAHKRSLPRWRRSSGIGSTVKETTSSYENPSRYSRKQDKQRGNNKSSGRRTETVTSEDYKSLPTHQTTRDDRTIRKRRTRWSQTKHSSTSDISLPLPTKYCVKKEGTRLWMKMHTDTKKVL